MDAVREKLSLAIQRRLRHGEAELETLPNGRIAGHVISSEFDGLSYAARRNLLWRLIDEELSPDEARQLSTLLTYTPDEWHAPLSDA